MRTQSRLVLSTEGLEQVVHRISEVRLLLLLSLLLGLLLLVQRAENVGKTAGKIGLLRLLGL